MKLNCTVSAFVVNIHSVAIRGLCITKNTIRCQKPRNSTFQTTGLGCVVLPFRSIKIHCISSVLKSALLDVLLSLNFESITMKDFCYSKEHLP